MAISIDCIIAYKTYQRVEFYRLGQAVEVLESSKSLSGEDVLPGFVLDLSRNALRLCVGV